MIRGNLDDRRAGVLMIPEHLYVHVPVCRAKCVYCDFFSVVGGGTAECSALVEHTLGVAQALAGRAADAGLRSGGLATLYVGGGTPTVLGGELVRLVEQLGGVFGLQRDAEVTVEGNPESVNGGLVEALAGAGVTRISIGVQSLDDGVLAWLGRPHTAEDAIAAIAAVQGAGLELSIDLIAGIPGVSRRRWLETLDRVVELGVTHVSVYPLAIEEGTPLALAIERGERSGPDDDASAQAMEDAAERLTCAGLVRYEVANYAVPGHESRHNRAYWTGRPYLALGGGAHGMLPGATARAFGLWTPDPETQPCAADDVRIRYAYANDVFFDATPAMSECLTAAEAAREDAMLGLRMAEGIDDALGNRAGVTGVLRSLADDGLLTHKDGRWMPTNRGWLLGNVIFGRVWNARSQ